LNYLSDEKRHLNGHSRDKFSLLIIEGKLSLKFIFDLLLIFFIGQSNFDPNCWNCFSGEKRQLNCLSRKNCWFNYRGREKCWPNEEISSSKLRFESILIFSIQWLSFDLNCWNYFSGENFQTNYLSSEKCRLICWGGNKCWSKEGISSIA